jgi:hypothetical protein
MPSTKYAIALLAVRMDAESILEDIRQIRRDRAAPKCGAGTKPCGNRCIPQDQDCHVDGNGGGSTNAGKIAAFAGAGLAGGAIGFSALKISQAVAERKRKAKLEPPEPEAIPQSKEGMKSAMPPKRNGGKPKNVRTKNNKTVKQLFEEANNSTRNSHNSTSKQNATLREPEEKPKSSIFGKFASGVKNTFKRKEKSKKGKPMKSAHADSLLSRLDAFIEQRSDSPKCEAGNKPCGKICIPESHSCAKETTDGALNGAGHGALGLLGPVGMIANGVIGARNGGGGKGAVKAIGRGLLGPTGGAVYGGLRARGHGRLSSGAAGVATSAATGLAIAAGVHALRKKKEKDLAKK